MSLEKMIAEIVRTVLREEMASFRSLDDLELLTAEDVARLLKFTDKHSVYKLRREGKLQGIMLGGKTLRFRRRDVRRLVDETTPAE